MSTQVQMRGGTTEEHKTFTGAPREVTIDTTKNTVVVHDGSTQGGFPLATEKNLTDFQKTINERLKEFENSIGATHNHDNLYSKLGHVHDERYSVKPTGCEGAFLKNINTYNGFTDKTGNDTGYLRTTKNGLLPYQSGGYSNIGSPSWRFANGYFDELNTNSVALNKGSINFNNDDVLSYDDTNNEFKFTSDGDVNKSRLTLGHIELSGIRIYTGSAFPSGARVGDILIQV